MLPLRQENMQFGVANTGEPANILDSCVSRVTAPHPKNPSQKPKAKKKAEKYSAARFAPHTAAIPQRAGERGTRPAPVTEEKSKA
jgi:hypothetical protein